MKALAARGANLHAVDSNGDGALELTQWSYKSEKLHAWLKEQGVQEQKAPEDMNHDHHGGGGNEHMYGGDQGHGGALLEARERRAEGGGGPT